MLHRTQLWQVHACCVTARPHVLLCSHLLYRPVVSLTAHPAMPTQQHSSSSIGFQLEPERLTGPTISQRCFTASHSSAPDLRCFRRGRGSLSTLLSSAFAVHPCAQRSQNLGHVTNKVIVEFRVVHHLDPAALSRQRRLQIIEPEPPDPGAQQRSPTRHDPPTTLETSAATRSTPNRPR